MDPFEFARIATGMLPREDETGSNEEPAQRGIPQKVSGIAGADSAGGYVSIDLGGSSVTEGDLQAVEMPTDIPVKAGDEVSVEIVDGKPRVVGRIGWGDELQSVADEALEVAQATGQYFWHDGNGAHVSTEALNPTGPSNSLWNSLGLLIRKAANNLVSITQSAIAFYDGLGNSASNIVASFGSSGFQVGRTGESHLIGDYHSMQLVDREGSSYFDVADLRDESGNATITDSFAGDGTTVIFYLGITAASTSYTVKRNGTTVTSGITKTATSFTFSTAPASGASITATYTVTSQNAKYYTLGTRGSGNVGGMSVSEGSGCVASGFLSHAEGDGTTASGYYAHAENSGTTASGNESHAEGLNTKATGRGAHAEGYNSVASGQFSHAEGNSEALGDYSHAHGRGAVSASNYQTAIGKFNVPDSSDTYAFIIGNGVGTGSGARNAMAIDWNGNETLAGGLTLGSPLTVANGGTGADSAADARANLRAVGYASGMDASVASFLGANQMWGLRAKVINANNTDYLDHSVYILLRNDGISAYDTTASSFPWQLTLPSGTTDLTVNVGDVSITNATATKFQTRMQGSVVNLVVYQLKVSASLADGASVSLGSGIIGSSARPSTNIYMPLMANVSGKGAGVFLYITSAGNVTLYNRSGSALGTGTNLTGNTTWVV